MRYVNEAGLKSLRVAGFSYDTRKLETQMPVLRLAFQKADDSS
jgi:hypothetical protein